VHLGLQLLGRRGGGAPTGLQLVAERLQLRAAGHHGRQLVAGDLALREVAEAAAALEQHEPVADGIGVVRVVGDEHDAEPALAGLDDVLEHHARLLDAPGPRWARRG
jgi:hypothetical protein